MTVCYPKTDVYFFLSFFSPSFSLSISLLLSPPFCFFLYTRLQPTSKRICQFFLFLFFSIFIFRVRINDVWKKKRKMRWILLFASCSHLKHTSGFFSYLEKQPSITIMFDMLYEEIDEIKIENLLDLIIIVSIKIVNMFLLL